MTNLQVTWTLASNLLYTPPVLPPTIAALMPSWLDRARIGLPFMKPFTAFLSRQAYVWFHFYHY